MDAKLLRRINGRVLGRLGFRLVRTRPSRREAEQSKRPAADPIEGVEDFRFRASDWIYSAPVAQMVGRPIFGYGPQSWHPLVAASSELLEDIATPYESSILKRFYQTFTPETIAEAYRLHQPGPLNAVPALSLFEPWSLLRPPFDDPYSSEFPSGSPLFGPLGDAAGVAEWRRLRGRVMSILKYGYQPDLFPRGRINVSVLRSDGQKRYLVGHGQHRAAVLAAMGATRIEVGIHSTTTPVVDESEAHLWPHVRSGFLTTECAVAALRRYFSAPESDPALEIGAAAGSRTAVLVEQHG